MNHGTLAIVFWYCLGWAVAVIIARCGRDLVKKKRRRQYRQQTLGMIFEAQTPGLIQEVSADEFILQLTMARSWGLTSNPSTLQLELVVSDGPATMPKMFTGPSPLTKPEEASKEFLAKVARTVEEKKIARNRRF